MSIDSDIIVSRIQDDSLMQITDKGIVTVAN